MLLRAMQRISTSPQTVASSETVYFDQLIQSWYNRSASEITYNNGIFTIANASSNDYYIAWTISVHSSTTYYLLGNSFILLSDYGEGVVSEGSYSLSYNTMALVKGYRLLSIKKRSSADILKLRLINNTLASTIFLSSIPSHSNEQTNLGIIGNASISIVAI